LGIRYSATTAVDGFNNEFVVLNINNFYGPVRYGDINGFSVNTVEIQSSSEFPVDNSDNQA
jgi:hypothetical protein